MDRTDSAPHPPPTPPHTVLPRSWAVWVWGHARKVVVAVIGGTIVLLGIAMLVLPGPGWGAIFAGLALLATEFAWARWMLKHAQERLAALLDVAGNAVGLRNNKASASSGERARPTAPIDRGVRQ